MSLKRKKWFSYDKIILSHTRTISLQRLGTTINCTNTDIPVSLQFKTVCCQTTISHKFYSQRLTAILIVQKHIPGSFVGTSGNGSVGTSGRFSVTD